MLLVSVVVIVYNIIWFLVVQLRYYNFKCTFVILNNKRTNMKAYWKFLSKHVDIPLSAVSVRASKSESFSLLLCFLVPGELLIQWFGKDTWRRKETIVKTITSVEWEKDEILWLVDNIIKEILETWHVLCNNCWRIGEKVKILIFIISCK